MEKFDKLLWEKLMNTSIESLKNIAFSYYHYTLYGYYTTGVLMGQ